MPIVTETLYDLICSAMRKAKVKKIGETPSPEEQDAALSELRGMLGAWSARKDLVSTVVRETLTLTSGQATYTISNDVSGSDFVSERPLELLKGCFIRDGSQDHPVDVITREEYASISQKTLTGRPRFVWYDDSYREGSLLFYYTPDANYAFHMASRKLITEYTRLATELQQPIEYEEAIKYGLALRLASEFGTQPSVITLELARDSLRKVNILNPHEPPVVDLGSIFKRDRVAHSHKTIETI